MVRYALRILLVTAFACGLYTPYIFATGNFHTVLAGQLYRSGQPTAEQIARWHRHYGIKTIVNLRGRHPDQDWYLIERAAARELGLVLIDYPISAKREVTAQQLEDLLALLAAAEPPVLIHCLDGADRSGLIAAFYVAGVAHETELYAEFQLTPFYGHMPLWFLPYFAMGRSFENAETRLGFPDS